MKQTDTKRKQGATTSRTRYVPMTGRFSVFTGEV